ncbi:uncharacterized protein EDB93DRAFT_641773 [Suillus bovinus]|uniref:uncharacterized protein n=1 Tax=Suillus bovinus TaxID=48563 RepID=UPI001B886BAD|nr:uncharacterized protein EDB93DRAFT_641773 [Suillus bovinus]KAG2141182.1 hypothetical protein EDB93DRAFT_641773 [Suillus bovinus]
MSYDQFNDDPRSHEGTWERLSQVAVKGAEYDSRERQPHPKCLDGTRVDLLDYIYGSLDNKEKSRLIWLHGTAGVGKSAVAFTVAQRMRDLKAAEQMNIEKRLAGTFFFSRKHTERCTTAYFFATLAYQLACNFPSIREDLNRAIRENPALLHPNKSLRNQMEGLFLKPLRKLQFRLRECPPSTFVVDALDECVSETEVADLISLLAYALRQPDLPVIHILLTSRSEAHICEAIRGEDVYPMVCEIPVKISGEGVAAIISLDGADVDNDIYIVLEHFFRKLRAQRSSFPQPTRDQLARLANRAGRRFIVASMMMKFIDDGYHDPRDRLQLLLEFTSELLPGTEVYRLYDSILATCTDPTRAYLHLSVIATLADPLPIQQISELLGPGEGKDIETTLVQLRSVINIPPDNSPVNLYHSSVRDYVSDPSNCNLPKVQHIRHPHSLLAQSSFRLMIQALPASTALLDALSELKRQSRAIPSHDLQILKHSLSFIMQPPEPLQALIGLLWLQGVHSPYFQCWLRTPDGHFWLQNEMGRDWLRTKEGKDWLQTEGAKDWLQTWRGKYWLQTTGGQDWLQTQGGSYWLQTQGGRDWLRTLSGLDWLQDLIVKQIELRQLRDEEDYFLQTVDTDLDENNWDNEGDFDENQQDIEPYFDEDYWDDEDHFDEGRLDDEDYWNNDSRFDEDLWDNNNHFDEDHWNDEDHRNDEDCFTEDCWDNDDCFDEDPGDYDDHFDEDTYDSWVQEYENRWPHNEEDPWLQTPIGRQWLAEVGQKWLQTQVGKKWLQIQAGQQWLQIRDGQDWLRSRGGREWLQSRGGREWLQTEGGQDWLQIEGGRIWVESQDGRDWLQTQAVHNWLRTESRQQWLQTESGREWLQTKGGREWLQTPHGQVWQSTPTEDFLGTLEAISEHTAISEFHSLPAFQVIQQFKSLPDVLMFPAFLAFSHQDHPISASPRGPFPPDMEIIHAMTAFVDFAKDALHQSQSASDALKYTCNNWVVHLSQARAPWDDTLNHLFKVFWTRHLLSWLEMQWCLKGLRSCLFILSEGQELAKAKVSQF